MAITLSQNPGTINQAYGVNAVSLSGITSEDKYVVRVKNQAGDVVADVRQTPNRYGQAIFDIQNILQTYVKPGDADIDSIGVNSTDRYRNSFNLGFKYDIEYGTETGGIFTSAGTVEDLEVYPGRKEYYNITWPISTYTADIIESAGEIQIENLGQGLTDNPTVRDYNISTTPGGSETLVVDVYSTQTQSFDPDLGQSPLQCPNIVLNDGGWRTTSPFNYYTAQDNASYKFVVEGQVKLAETGVNPGDVFPTPFDIQRQSDGAIIPPDLVVGWPPASPLPGPLEVFNFRLEWNSVDLLSNGTLNLILLPNEAPLEARVETLPNTNVKIYKLEGGGPGETIPVKAYEHTVRPDDRVTVSYLQKVNVTGSAPESKCISGFTVLTFDESDNLLFENTYPNLLSEGGGPYATQGEAVTASYPYTYMTFGAGPANLDNIDFSQAAYYYVLPQIFDADYPTDYLHPEPAWYSHKFTIDRGICLDFEPIQFSWMNSLGTRDYYTFTKKNERSVRIKRDTYLKSAADYNGVTYQVEPEDRGTTTYSQQLDQEYIANTDYISDLDAEWMESLFVSPDVRVRFSGETQWFPVTLTSSSYTQKTFKKDRLFQYEVRFKLAHGIKSQRG